MIEKGIYLRWQQDNWSVKYLEETRYSLSKSVARSKLPAYPNLTFILSPYTFLFLRCVL